MPSSNGEVDGLARLAGYLARRAIQGAITVLIITMVVFALFEAQGDPTARFRSDPSFTKARLVELNETYGYNQPREIRFFIFIKNMFTGNFGITLDRQPVAALLAERIPRTLILFGLATVLEYTLGILIGSYIAWRRGGPAEGTTIVSSLFFRNMPSFWIGLVFIWIFAFRLDIFPLRGFADPSVTNDHFKFLSQETFRNLTEKGGLPLWFSFVDFGWHLILPLIVLLLISSAGAILLMRTSMLEVLGEDYIITAKAKGLREKVVRKHHANRNAYLPVVTSLTISLAFAIQGAIILEGIFSYQGVGYTFLQALINQDQFLAGATLFIISILVIIGNTAADMLYGVLDPRVRL